MSPSLKAYKIPGRARLFEAVQRVREVNAQRLQTAIQQHKAVRGEDGKYRFASTSFDANALNADPALGLSYIVAPPRMQRYLDVSTQIYKTYLKYVSPADIYPYSIDEVFIDVTGYLPYYHMSAHELAMTMVREVLYNTGITATAGIGTNLYPVSYTHLTIDIAENGKIAVEKVMEAPEKWYDLIFMDIQMPIMNGYEATAAIRALAGSRGKVPIIAMTANAFAEDVQLAKNTGMNEHIAKPLDLNKLNDVLKQWL